MSDKGTHLMSSEMKSHNAALALCHGSHDTQLSKKTCTQAQAAPFNNVSEATEAPLGGVRDLDSF